MNLKRIGPNLRGIREIPVLSSPALCSQASSWLTPEQSQSLGLRGLGVRGWLQPYASTLLSRAPNLSRFSVLLLGDTAYELVLLSSSLLILPWANSNYYLLIEKWIVSFFHLVSYFRISLKFYRMSYTYPQIENRSASNVSMVVSGGALTLHTI